MPSLMIWDGQFGRVPSENLYADLDDDGKPDLAIGRLPVQTAEQADVLAARRMKKKGESVRPRNPHETFVEHNCATIGPMGCRGQPTIDMFTAAAALTAMAERLAKGQEIGSLFVTDPQTSEYQYYQAAKKEREAKKAEKAAAAAKAKAAPTKTDGPAR